MGLGQLYLLLEAKNTKGESVTQNELINNYNIETDELLIIMTQILKKERYASEILSNCLSVSYLSMAAEIAIFAGDEHREIDALANIVNAIYFAKQALLEEQAWNENEILVPLREKIDTVANRKKYPYIISKYLLTRGDIIFAKLFSIDTISYQAAINRKGEIVVKKYNPKKEITDWRNLEKAKLREMMYNYLDALNLLSGQTTFHTLEFSNMLKQIKRRIMLVHDEQYVSLLKEGFSVIWQNFERLASRNEIMREIESTMKMHEISLKIRSSTS